MKKQKFAKKQTFLFFLEAVRNIFANIFQPCLYPRQKVCGRHLMRCSFWNKLFGLVTYLEIADAFSAFGAELSRHVTVAENKAEQ